MQSVADRLAERPSVRRFAAAAVLAAALSGQGARSADHRRIQDLAGRVPLIVAGRCTSVRSAWNDEKTLITTTTTYDVERVVKGDLERKKDLVVRQVGGSVGNITQRLVGGPRFEVGERSLLFLRPDASGELRIYGLGLGKRRIDRDPASGIDRVRLDDAAEPDPPGLPDPSRPATSALPAARGGGRAAEDVSLDSLVETLLDGPRTER